MIADRKKLQLAAVLERARAPARGRSRPVRVLGSALPLLLLLLTSASPADARLRLGASPLKLHVFLRPGTEQARAVTIYNSGDESVRVVAGVSEWTTTSDGGMDLSPASPVSRSAAAWITPEVSEFILAPHENRVVRISAALPDSASGSYWAIVFFEGESAANRRGLGFQTKARIGTTVYLTASGTEQRNDEITRIDVAKGQDPARIDLSFNLKNAGNVYHYPAGWMQVLGANDERILEERLPLRVLLPGAESCYQRTWHPPAPGSYRLVVTLDLGTETLIQGIKEFAVQDTIPFVRLVLPDGVDAASPPSSDAPPR
jgi:hypothetical protein